MSTRVLLRATAVAAAVGVAVALVPATASAAPAGLEIDYTATGSTTLSNPNSAATVTFKPTTLRSFVDFQPDQTGAIKAFLPLAPVTTSFQAYGFLPAKGTVVFTQVGTANGVLGLYDEQSGFPLSVTARYVVSLRNVTIGGAAANVGPNCQSVRPVVVAVTAQPGFDLVNGTLDGSYDLSNFTNCGAAQTIINDTVPGRGNRLSLSISLGDSAAAKRAVAAVVSESRAGATAAR